MRNVNKCEFALDLPIFYFVEWGDAMVTNLWQCDNGGHLVTGPWASWCHEGGGIIGNIYFETRTFYCVLWSHHHTMLTPESWGGINGQGWHNGWGLDGGRYLSVMDPCSLCLAPRWRNINKADTMAHNGHNTPPGPNTWCQWLHWGKLSTSSLQI